jgi:putative ABC transport system permease protein
VTTATRRRRARPGLDLAGVLGRARTDRWPLLVAVAVVALTAFLAVLTPRLVDRTADASVRDALARAGSGADTTVTVPFRPDGESGTERRDPAGSTVGDSMRTTAALPDELSSVLAPPVAAVVTRSLRLALPAPSTLPPTGVRLAWVWDAGAPGVDWIAGGPPGASAEGVQVGLSEQVAAAVGAGVGDRLTAQGSTDVVLTVTGIFQATDPGAPVWSQAPEALAPRVSGAGPHAQADVTALLSDASLPAARLAVDADEITRTITYTPVAARFRAADVDPVVRAVTRLRTAGGTFPLESTPRVDSRLGTVLLEAQTRLRAAEAQAPVLLTAVVVTAALALLLTGQLLVQRRGAVLATSRARGGSLPATAVELGLESVVVALVGGGLGLLAADLVRAGPTPWTLLIVVLVVAAGTGPVLGVRAAARATGGRRVPADRRHRRALRRDRQVRRAVVEAAVVLLAVGALAALRLRGVLASSASPGGDLLLAAAPTLAVLAGAVVLFRLTPLLARLGLGWATRSRHAVPLLAAARVQAATRALPVLALTAATGLAVLALTLGATVRAGQVDASWTAVGADVTVTTDPDPELTGTADRLAARPGVELAVPARVEDGLQLLAAAGGDRATVVVVDPAAFARLLASTPLPDAPDLSRLTGGPQALVSADLPLDATGTALLWNGEQVPFTAVGRVPALAPDEGTTVVLSTGSVPADLAAPDTVWVVGDGAAEAVAAAPELTGADVVDRHDRLTAERAAPLTTGLVALVGGSAVVLVALAALVVVLAAQAGGPERRRTLATVRTLGLTGRQVRRVSAGELLPGVLLSTVGGGALGVLVAWLVTTPLELQRVTGQTTAPTLVVPWWTPAVVLPLLLAVAGVLALESSLRRRERLGEVLRVGQASG